MRSVLRSEGAVGRLFRSWGGEALYNSHEDDLETGPLLRRIGTPCIWIVVLPIGQGVQQARPDMTAADALAAVNLVQHK